MIKISKFKVDFNKKGKTIDIKKGKIAQRILMEVEVVRTKITLACTECKNRNYNMTKDKKAHPDRMKTERQYRRAGALMRKNAADASLSICLMKSSWKESRKS